MRGLLVLLAVAGAAAASSAPKVVHLNTQPKLNPHRKPHKPVQLAGAVSVAGASSKKGATASRSIPLDANVYYLTVPVSAPPIVRGMT